MYKKILVAYDGSGFSEVALHQAADLARLCKAELNLLGIMAITSISAVAQGTGSIDIWGMERKQIEDALETAARDLASQSLNVMTSIREGNPAIEIISYAHEMKADLVVIGHTDKGVLERLFEGSVGAKLLRDLPCSLLIATGKA